MRSCSDCSSGLHWHWPHQSGIMVTVQAFHCDPPPTGREWRCLLASRKDLSPGFTWSLLTLSSWGQSTLWRWISMLAVGLCCYRPSRKPGPLRGQKSKFPTILPVEVLPSCSLGCVFLVERLTRLSVFWLCSFRQHIYRGRGFAQSDHWCLWCIKVEGIL